jgi:hypothetical protein
MKNLLLFFVLLQAWVCKAQMLARSQAVADLDEYNRVLNEVHYNPFLYITPAAYNHKTDSVKRSIGDSIDIKSFILKLGELTAVLNDGHTMPAVVQPVLKADFRKPIFFPLSLSAGQDEQLRTKFPSAPSGIPTGAAVLTVNEVNLNQFYKQAKAYIGGLPTFKKVMAEGLLSNYLYYSGVKPPFRITYAISGRTHTATIPEGVILKESLSKAFPQLAGTNYTFKIVDNKVGYLNLISMSGDYKRYEAFFDSCFTVIKTAKIGTVAIDLRQNSGGNSIIGDLLISYFSTKPHSLSGGRYRKVSQRYKDYLISRGDTGNLYLKQSNNTIIDQRRCGPHDPMFVNNKLLFGGKVYLITGPATFSSAMQLADAVKQYHLATVIGQPTGELTNDFGEVYKFDLPYSKIQMQVTTTFDLGADCDAKRHSPVIPDHLINNLKRSQPSTSDAVLEYLLKRS